MSAKPGGDMLRIANAGVSAIRKRGALRIAGMRSRPASGTGPDTTDRLLRSRTSSGTPASSWERTVAAHHYTTSWG